MRKVTKYQIANEPCKKMRKSQRYNPALEIRFRDRSGIHTHTLNAGYDDDLYVYREACETYVLSLNHKLGYVGLQTFDGSDVVGELFLNESQLKGTLDHMDYAPFTIIRRLRDYVSH